MFTNMININNNQYRVTFAKLSCKHHPGGRRGKERGEGQKLRGWREKGAREGKRRDWPVKVGCNTEESHEKGSHLHGTSSQSINC